MQQISRETFGRTLPISLTLAALDFLNKCSAIFAANTFGLPDILAVSLSLSSRPQFHYYNLGFVAFASRFQICFYSENSCLRTIFNQNFLLNFPRMIEYSGTKKSVFSVQSLFCLNIAMPLSVTENLKCYRRHLFLFHIY